MKACWTAVSFGRPFQILKYIKTYQGYAKLAILEVARLYIWQCCIITWQKVNQIISTSCVTYVKLAQFNAYFTVCKKNRPVMASHWYVNSEIVTTKLQNFWEKICDSKILNACHMKICCQLWPVCIAIKSLL